MKGDFMTGEFGRKFRPKPLSPKEVRELRQIALASVAAGALVSAYVFVHHNLAAWEWFGAAIAGFVLAASASVCFATWLVLTKGLPILFRPIGAKKK